jgi:hypothetical protein
VNYTRKEIKKRVQISRPYEPKKKKSKQETEIKTKFLQFVKTIHK